jgi:formate-dependent phosphoribosylglycinamide formyltransferase (GAR transformylase)
MNVILIEPFFPNNQRRFALALRNVGATVIGIGEYDENGFDPELRDALSYYYRVPSVVNIDALRTAVAWAQDQVWVDRMESTVEAHILPVAQVREEAHIPGTSVRTAWLCRDKPAMKDALRSVGVPTAASIAADNADQVVDFANRIGFPIILKPRAAAGASGTVRVDSMAELAQALNGFGDVDSIAVEEFVSGHEGFYDTLCIDGNTTHDFVSHYYPNVLDGMRERWISPQFISTNQVDSAPAYGELKEMGARVNHALGIGTSATHMEWFFGDKGLYFSEIGCRPPGVGAWDLYSVGNDVDLYTEWAHAIVHGRTDRPLSRRFASGLVALRPDRDGAITGYSGIDDIAARMNEWVIDAHFPNPGTPTQPVEAGFMANAYVRMKHPDFDTVRGMLDEVGRTVHVHAG